MKKNILEQLEEIFNPSPQKQRETKITGESGLPDKIDDVWRVYPAGYKGYDDGPHNIGKPAEYKRRWTDIENVQVLTGFNCVWVEGDGYVAPEMVVIPQAGMPRHQQNPPWLNLYDEYDPDGSPLGFTQKLFARNGKVSLTYAREEADTLLGAQEYELWLWVYPYTEVHGKPDYNTNVYSATLSFGNRSDIFPLESLTDNVLAMPLIGPKVDTAKFSFHIDQPSNQDVSHSLFIKAYGLIKVGEPQPVEPKRYTLPYVATVNLISQTATFKQAGAIFEQSFDQKRTFTFSHDDAISLVTAAMDGSKIHVWGDRNTADYEQMNEAGAKWEYHHLPDQNPIDPDYGQGYDHILDVPFVSQLGKGAEYYNDCGPASCAMIYEYLTKEEITPKQIADEMNKAGQLTSIGDNREWMKAQGISTNYFGPYDDDGPITEQVILNQIELGRPVFLLVDYPELPNSRANQSYTGWHFFICYGYSSAKEQELRFYIHDPLSVSEREWLLSWSELERALVGDGRNLARQGFSAWLPEPKEEPAPNKIDILDYMQGKAGQQYIMKHTITGEQERCRYEIDTAPPPGMQGGFYIVKNHLFERYAFDKDFIYLIEDNSPDNADDGTDRFYRVTTPEGELTPYCPRYMTEGEHWQGALHHVQFYSKNNCSTHPQNSGTASNAANLRTVDSGFITDEKYVSGSYIELVVNNERQFFEKGEGRIAWVSAWGAFERTPEDVNGQAWIERQALKC